MSRSKGSAFLELTTEGQPDMFRDFSGVTPRLPSPTWQGRGGLGVMTGAVKEYWQGFGCSVLVIFGRKNPSPSILLAACGVENY